jgi:adenosylcobinamide-GDP ribazoletransferase
MALTDPENPETDDDAGYHLWSDLRLGTAFLTRLPLELTEAESGRKLADVAWTFPVVGAIVGLASGAALWVGLWLGLDPLAAALLAVAAAVLLTGGLHEDGLADTADGFGGGKDKADKLRIMDDPTMGAFGVLALIITVGLKSAIVAGMVGPGTAIAALIGAAIGSRAAMPVLMYFLKPAKRSGLGAGAGKPNRAETLIAALIGGVGMLLVLGAVPGAAGLIAAAAAYVAISGTARRHIGGFTGDVLGALQQVTEIFILAAVATATV